MSAAELLKQVKALPPAERRKFLKSVAKLKAPPKRRRKPKPQKPVKWPDIMDRMKRIYGDRPPGPNLVLLERETYTT